MIELNWTLFAQIINFLVLVYLLNVVLFRPIRQEFEGAPGPSGGL